MIGKLMIALAALSICGASVADAASHKRHAKKYRHAHPVVHQAPVIAEPAYRQFPSRPPWAAPQQCFIEEGYGRFFPCGGGPSIH
jgi:hypothetical protein